MNKKGKLMIYCSDCRTYFTMLDEHFDWVCPKCGRLLLKMRCTRCGHIWELRNRDKLPDHCANPKCHSVYWCRDRVRDKKTGKLIPSYQKKKDFE